MQDHITKEKRLRKNVMQDHITNDDSVNSKPAYYAVIPASVRYSKTIEPMAKLLYGEITALCSQEGYCWASNAYLANLYEVDVSTIKRWMASLVKSGFIRTESYNQGFKKCRKIFIVAENQINITKAQNEGHRKLQKNKKDAPPRESLDSEPIERGRNEPEVLQRSSLEDNVNNVSASRGGKERESENLGVDEPIYIPISLQDLEIVGLTQSEQEKVARVARKERISECSIVNACQGVFQFLQQDKEIKNIAAFVTEAMRRNEIRRQRLENSMEIREEGTIPYAFYRTGRDREIS